MDFRRFSATSGAPSVPIFLSIPDLQIPTQTLNLHPDLPLHHLLPSSQTLDAKSFYLSFNGMLLSSDSTPSLSRIPPFSTLTLRLRLHGGGGDGGSTCAESRDCYLNMYASKKPDKVDPNETRLCKWTTCALSSEPLAPPCVVDGLGNLFNKERLLQALLEKKLPKEFKHIRGMKDMVEVFLEEIPGWDGEETRFRCPITGLEFNGKYGFLAFWGCGHVVSVKAMKEVKEKGCLVCRKEFREGEKIVINGSAGEVAMLRKRLEEERENLREKKKLREKKLLNLSGVKRVHNEKDGIFHVCTKEAGGKKFKAVDIAPVNANKKVYASIFTSSRKSDLKETYTCRSLPLGRN